MFHDLINFAAWHRHLSGDDGQDMVEYALLLGMLSVTALAIVVLVGPQISDTFRSIINSLGLA